MIHFPQLSILHGSIHFLYFVYDLLFHLPSLSLLPLLPSSIHLLWLRLQSIRCYIFLFYLFRIISYIFYSLREDKPFLSYPSRFYLLLLYSLVCTPLP